MAEIIITGYRSAESLLGEKNALLQQHHFIQLGSKPDLVQYLSTANHLTPDLLLVGPNSEDTVSLLQLMYNEDKDLSILILRSEDDYSSTKMQIQFAPFIGSNVKILKEGDSSEIAGEIQAGVQQTVHRRKFKKSGIQNLRIVPSFPTSDSLKQLYLGKFMELAPVGAILLNSKKIIEAINRQASLFFSNVPNPIGTSICSLFPDNLRTDLDKFIEQVNVSEGSNVKTVQIASNGNPKYLDIIVNKDFQLEIPGYSIVILLDVTERIIWEELLKANEARLQLTLTSAELGTWDYSPITGQLIWDERCRELFGLNADEDVDFEVFLEKIHLEDRERVQLSMQKALESPDNPNFDIEYRTAGGSVNKFRWIKAKGRAFFNGNNMPYRFLGTAMDVTDIVKSRLILEQSIVQRDEFISIASHELKTPLTSLKAYVQLVVSRLKNSGDPLTLEYMKRVTAQVGKLNILISELLDLSKLEQGKLVFKFESVDFNTLVREVVNNLQPTSSSHKINFSGHVSKPVLADKHRMEQVLINYLTNAIKYSPAANQVEVELMEDSENVIVKVKDFGIGIPQANHFRIFERFYRVEGIAHRFQGFGIGLYIVSEIVKMHKGKVWMHSTPGKGSEFYFSIPFQKQK